MQSEIACDSLDICSWDAVSVACRCNSEQPLDVIFILDDVSWAVPFEDSLPQDARVGLIASSTVWLTLAQSEGMALADIKDVAMSIIADTGGLTNIDAALQDAIDMFTGDLAAGRRRVVVLITDGGVAADLCLRGPQLKAIGAGLVVVGVGADWDASFVSCLTAPDNIQTVASLSDGSVQHFLSKQLCVASLKVRTTGERRSLSDVVSHDTRGHWWWKRSDAPTGSPTLSPIVEVINIPPTANPSYRQWWWKKPTDVPSHSPSKVPTTSPTKVPTGSPTLSPIIEVINFPPTTNPSYRQWWWTSKPTWSPTGSPTESPTKGPTESPTETPTSSPTGSPTESPTKMPTESPTKVPTGGPTVSPTSGPTGSPTLSPIIEVINFPPTASPSHRQWWWKKPTDVPSKSPTKVPTGSPTLSPIIEVINFPPTANPSYRQWWWSHGGRDGRDELDAGQVHGDDQA
jgi:hypothetical protein